MLRHWRPAVFILVVSGVALAYYFSGARAYFQPAGLALLRDDILSLGGLGIAAYVATYIVGVSVGLPNMPFQVAAGALYGPAVAFALMYFGANVGSLGAFTFARHLGRRTVEELQGPKRRAVLASLNKRLERGGKRYLITVRIIPFVPFSLINYTAGISRMRTRDYVLANLPGLAPLTFMQVMMGHGISLL